MLVLVAAATAAMADRRCLREHLTAATRETATSPCCGQHAKIKHGFACACACVCEPRRGTQTPTWAAWDPGQRSKGWHPWTQSGSSRTCLGDPGPGPGAPNPVSEAGPELIVFFSHFTCEGELGGIQRVPNPSCPAFPGSPASQRREAIGFPQATGNRPPLAKGNPIV
jgi:hypothetical protein